MVYNIEHTIDDVFIALSHPARRQMIEQLENSQLTVSQLASEHDLSKAQITKHLHILERCGIIEREKRGREHWLSLSPESLKGVDDWVQHYRHFWSVRLKQLDKYVKKKRN